MLLTVVIPTLNAAATLPACLAAVWPDVGVDVDVDVGVVVADGGSADGTVDVAAAAGARAVTAPRGRGAQLQAGAEAALAAGAEALVLLHADTRLPPDWQQVAAAHLAARPDAAGFFRLSFDEDSPGARRVARLANWRARRLGLPYGDQGLLIGADLYRAVGGVAPLPLMEDVDLARRLGRGRLVELPGAVVTGADRYRRGGWWVRPVRNLGLLGLYLLGVSPVTLARWYG